MIRPELPRTNQIVLAITGVIAGFVVKLAIDSLISSYSEILYIVLFILISIFILKGIILPIYIWIYSLISPLKIGEKAEKIEDCIGKKEFNVLIPAIVMSLIIFDLLSTIEMYLNNYVFSFVITVILGIILFLISLKLTEIIPFIQN